MSANTNSLMERLPLLHGRAYRLWARSLSIKGTTWTFRHQRLTKSSLLSHWLLVFARTFPPSPVVQLRPTPWRMLLEFHLRDLSFMSAEHDVKSGHSAGRSITKRHLVSCKLSRWDASVTHLFSSPILHVHSSRRCSCSQQQSSLSLPSINL